MSVYNLFDEIFCILSSENSINNFSSIVDKTVQIKYFDIHENKFQSHIEIIQYAYRNQLKNIIVFEDNILIRNDIQHIKKIKQAMATINYDVVCLSSNIFNCPTTNAIIY